MLDIIQFIKKIINNIFFILKNNTPTLKTNISERNIYTQYSVTFWTTNKVNSYICKVA